MNEAITQLYTALLAHGQALAPRLVEQGAMLTGALLVITLSYQSGMALIKGGGVNDYLSIIIKNSLSAGIVLWLVRGVPEIGGQVIAGFDLIGTTLSGAAPGSNPLVSGLQPVLTMTDELWRSMSADRSPPSWWEAIKNTLTGGVSFWVKVLTMMALVLVAAVAGAMFIFSQILSGIALAFGPVLLPFYLLKPLSFMATGWVKFFITAGVMKVVGVVMLSFGPAMTGALATLSVRATGADAGTLDLGAAIVTFLFAIVMLMMAWQIPAIANGLMSGAVSGLDPGAVTGAATQAAQAMKGGGRVGGEARDLARRAVDTFKNRKG